MAFQLTIYVCVLMGVFLLLKKFGWSTVPIQDNGSFVFDAGEGGEG